MSLVSIDMRQIYAFGKAWENGKEVKVKIRVLRAWHWFHPAGVYVALRTRFQKQNECNHDLFQAQADHIINDRYAACAMASGFSFILLINDRSFLLLSAILISTSSLSRPIRIL